MIAVDTSAVIAILQQERDAPAVRACLGDALEAVISAASCLELQLVVQRMNPGGWDAVEALLARYRISVRAFDADQLAIAREAASRYGRGRHPAKLNYGDCFAYALAKSEGAPLLYVGGDFALTDIRSALT